MVELNQEDIYYFSQFEKISKVMPSDYMQTESSIFFLVDAPSLGRAIGRKGINIQNLSRFFKKRVFVVANLDDPELFVRGFFSNITVISVEIRDVMSEKAIILTVDENQRGLAIGKDGERIKTAKALLQRKFNATLHLRTRKTF